MVEWAAITIGVIFLVSAFLTAFAGIYGAPYVPAPVPAVTAMLDYLHIGPRDVFIDIGAGDGRAAIAAAKRGAKAVGYELSPFMFLVCMYNKWRKKSNATFHLRDGFRADVSGATVVFMFLMPKTNTRALRYLSRTLRPGTKIVTYAFPIKEWEPVRSVRVRGNARKFGTIRVYEVSSDTVG